ncbi:hypothetical protein CONLIGDRAFT_646477 [Coniochaeta ligniaria NRRL 30616]|uniref:Uncharacterized protein n=1 Tax=Coniochaeta ligniaria NRRL 30616 TaxID=1408157 RepID=A0A1J7IG88_9PEZI|nr:hypothetical protein CONLIGDRAFT_646477 [Coniochaeta ligniaria NRRL 30616]
MSHAPTLTVTLIRDGDARRTVLGPLTTTFTPPEGCDKCFDHFNLPTGVNCVAYYWDCDSRRPCIPVIGDVSTIPPGFYSPGFHCPEGWLTALIIDSQLDIFLTLLPDETAALCCPSEYPAAIALQTSGASLDGAPAACINEVSSSVSSFFSCSLDSKFDEISAAATMTGLGIAPAIQINWRPADLVATRTVSSTVTVMNGTGISADRLATKSFGKPELIGIIIGTILATALLCGGVSWYLMTQLRRGARKAKDIVPLTTNVVNQEEQNKLELDATSRLPRCELPSPCSSDGPNSAPSQLQTTDWALISPDGAQNGTQREPDTVERIENIEGCKVVRDNRQ